VSKCLTAGHPGVLECQPVIPAAAQPVSHGHAVTDYCTPGRRYFWEAVPLVAADGDALNTKVKGMRRPGVLAGPAYEQQQCSSRVFFVAL